MDTSAVPEELRRSYKLGDILSWLIRLAFGEKISDKEMEVAYFQKKQEDERKAREKEGEKITWREHQAIVEGRGYYTLAFENGRFGLRWVNKSQ